MVFNQVMALPFLMPSPYLPQLRFFSPARVLCSNNWGLNPKCSEVEIMSEKSCEIPFFVA